MSEIKVLKVLLYNDTIGTLTHLPGDKNLFAFDEGYVNNPSRPILSLSFKGSWGELITEVKTTRTRLPPFFSNLLPEGDLREYLAKRAGINPVHEFSLLSSLGSDLPGALTIQDYDKNGGVFPSINTLLKEEKSKDPVFHFSLAGVQLKFSAIEKMDHGLVIPVDGVGGDWIIKLPHTSFRGVPENEYTMMELARMVGIDVPPTMLRKIEELQGLPKGFEKLGNSAFVIKRFDRKDNGDKVHIEDFAQVFGVYPEKKYDKANYRNIAEVISREVGSAGIAEFIKRFVFNALIGNGDMHLKNWSLIYREGNKVELAPAYDFVSTILYLPEDRLALNFVDNKEFSSLTLDEFKRFASKVDLSEKLVVDTVQETVQKFSEAWKTVKDLPLEKELKSAIEKHLKTIPLWYR
ncbi:MAG: type II toxin-antitoxin system HipA family toxin [Chlamydiae bacterium]|nr:type II toxin-antitoxin system HipA family toxin [Chlamydiota bacterium]